MPSGVQGPLQGTDHVQELLSASTVIDWKYAHVDERRTDGRRAQARLQVVCRRLASECSTAAPLPASVRVSAEGGAPPHLV